MQASAILLADAMVAVEVDAISLHPLLDEVPGGHDVVGTSGGTRPHPPWSGRQPPERGLLPVPCAGLGTYCDVMAHRRRSVFRVLLTALALARSS